MAATNPTEKKYGISYYVKGAVAGGICCSVTHGGMCPVDVVKTRIQLDPAKYNKGMVGGFKQVIAEEGMGALATGLGPTVVGYFVQGWFKFGGVEFFKINFAQYLGAERAWELRTAIYLAAAAMAEFIADIFLCPSERVRLFTGSHVRLHCKGFNPVAEEFRAVQLGRPSQHLPNLRIESFSSPGL